MGTSFIFVVFKGRRYKLKDVSKLRLNNDKIIISNEYSKIMELEFEKCYYYGDVGAEGFVKKVNVDERLYLCYDYIASIVEESMKSTLFTQTMILLARYGFIVPTASMEILLLGMLVQFQN